MPLTHESKPLGELLIHRGFLQRSQLDVALGQQRQGARTRLLGEILIEQKWCSPEQVTETLAASYGIPFARVTPKLADPKVIGLLPRAFIERNRLLPLFKVDGVLTVALSEPCDIFLIDEIARLGGCEVQVVAATAHDIEATLQVYLPHDQVFVIDEILDDLEADKFSMIRSPGAPPCADPAANDPMVVKLVRYCLYKAVQETATEIHVEPGEKDFRVRYRIDGRLIEKRRPPRAMHAGVVARLKWMAGLDAAETAKPRSGAIRLLIDGRPICLMLSTAPTRLGQVVVLRLSDATQAPLNLEKLGFGYDTFKQWRRLIASPQGLVLVTGPAASGKRTTLYASLRELNAAELNLCTIEDVIETTVPGVNQTQVDERAGLTYPEAFSAVLGQSPDVVMVGDVRDAQTARLSAQAALDGRLILAGASAADAPAAVSWLLNLGCPPYLLGAALSGVLAQRLVRKLCQACKEPYEPPAGELRQLDRGGARVGTLYRPKGCPRCRNIGFFGRIALHEILIPDDHFRQRLSEGAPQAELRELARAGKFKTLRSDGVEKVRSGITTLDEVSRVTA